MPYTGTEDIITRAFVTALRTYQQDHGQPLTYDLTDLLRFQADAVDSLQDQQQQDLLSELIDEDNRGLPTPGKAEEHLQPSQADISVEGQQQLPSAVLHAHHQSGQAVMNSAQPHNNHRHMRLRYSRSQLLQLQIQQKARLLSSGGLPSSCGTEQRPEPTYAEQPDNRDASYQQYQQYYQQQQHQGYPQHSWGYTPYWGRGWGTWAGTDGNLIWDSQQGAATAQQQQHNHHMPPPLPPPAPPVPGQLIAAASQQASACRVCGKHMSQGTPETAAARDQDSIRAALLSQVPRDVAAVPESLAAAEAAIEKAAIVSQSAECRSNMPELMMAWFYAGYHAGKISAA